MNLFQLINIRFINTYDGGESGGPGRKNSKRTKSRGSAKIRKTGKSKTTIASKSRKLPMARSSRGRKLRKGPRRDMAAIRSKAFGAMRNKTIQRQLESGGKVGFKNTKTTGNPKSVRKQLSGRDFNKLADFHYKYRQALADKSDAMSSGGGSYFVKARKKAERLVKFYKTKIEKLGSSTNDSRFQRSR